MLSFSHPGSTCLPTIGVWIDFSESAWGVKYAHTLHIHGSALGTPTMEYHSVMNLPCVEKDGMHFHLCELEGERTQCGVGGEEGQGLSRASCWLQEEIDPGEALTPAVFFFLPLRPIQKGQIPSVASKATPRAAAAPAPMAAHLGPGLDVKMDASGPCSPSPRDYSSSSLLPTSAFLPSLSLVLPLLPSLFIQLASKRKPFFKRGVVSLAFHISVVAVFKVATLPEIPRSSVSSNR